MLSRHQLLRQKENQTALCEPSAMMLTIQRFGILKIWMLIMLLHGVREEVQI